MINIIAASRLEFAAIQDHLADLAASHKFTAPVAKFILLCSKIFNRAVWV